jgi:Protein of unknown function (DUF3761)
MEEKKNGTRWGLIGGVGVAGLLALGALSNSQFAADTQTQPQSSTVVEAVATSSDNHAAVLQPQEMAASTLIENVKHEQATNTPSTKSDLSNNRSYTNVSGHSVHAPAYDLDGDIPAGASARCRDGTYSFSQNHRGTCSHHGGVSQWL